MCTYILEVSMTFMFLRYISYNYIIYLFLPSYSISSLKLHLASASLLVVGLMVSFLIQVYISYKISYDNRHSRKGSDTYTSSVHQKDLTLKISPSTSSKGLVLYLQKGSSPLCNKATVVFWLCKAKPVTYDSFIANKVDIKERN